jgi:hypothetical protein
MHECESNNAKIRLLHVETIVFTPFVILLVLLNVTKSKLIDIYMPNYLYDLIELYFEVADNFDQIYNMPIHNIYPSTMMACDLN